MSTNGPDFFETRMGRTFYEGTMRRIAAALENIAKELHQQNQPYECDQEKGWDDNEQD